MTEYYEEYHLPISEDWLEELRGLLSGEGLDVLDTILWHDRHSEEPPGPFETMIIGQRLRHLAYRDRAIVKAVNRLLAEAYALRAISDGRPVEEVFPPPTCQCCGDPIEPEERGGR